MNLHLRYITGTVQYMFFWPLLEWYVTRRECGRGQIQRNDGLWYWAEYSTFSVSDEGDNYRLTVDGYSGDAGDAMAAADGETWNANGKPFSAPDRDNDGAQYYHCSAAYGMGWWFDLCSVLPL